MDCENILFSKYLVEVVTNSCFYEKIEYVRNYEFILEEAVDSFKGLLAEKLFDICNLALTEYYESIDGDEEQWSVQKIHMKYPVLEELEHKKIEYECNGFLKIIDDLKSNIELIQHQFNMGSVKVVNIDTSMGDCHKNKVVARLEFSDGTSLMYKTRETVGERMILALDEVIETAFAVPKTEKFDGFFIQEYVEKTQFESEEQIKDYYYKFGKMVAVFASLGTTDIHSENVIATVSGPKFIDLETIVSIVPETYWFDSSAIKNTMMFPGCLNKKVYAGMDVSSFSGGDNDGNIPVRKNYGRIKPENYIEYVLTGYDDACNIILNNKKAFVECVKRNLNGVVRKVVRNTAFYGTMLKYSYSPVYLESPEKREHLFELLSEHSVLAPSIIQHEKEELKELLIPIFECDLDSDDGSVHQKQLLIKKLENIDKLFFDRERNVILLAMAIKSDGKNHSSYAERIDTRGKSRIDYECERFLTYGKKGNKLSYVTFDRAVSENILEYNNDIFVFGGALITLAIHDRINGKNQYLQLIKNTVKEKYRFGDMLSGLMGADAEKGLLLILYRIYEDEEFLSILNSKKDKEKNIKSEDEVICDLSGIGSSIMLRIAKDSKEEIFFETENTEKMIEMYRKKYLGKRQNTGLFHGYSGDLMLFTELSNREKIDIDMQMLSDIVKKENQYFLESIHNWNDIRGGNIHDMVAISYGAPGVILARVFLKYRLENRMCPKLKETVEQDIRRGVFKILSMKRMEYYDDTIINGYSGALIAMVVVLMYADGVFSKSEIDRIKDYLAEGRRELEETTWRCQGIDKAYIPNFLNGNMGITFLLIIIDNYTKIVKERA